MLDEQDQGTRIGVGVALGVVLLLIVGLLGWLSMRGGKPTVPATTRVVQAAAAVTPMNAATAAAPLPADAGVAMAAIKQAALADAGKKLLLSGFHDASGDPAKNAELAKNRAKAMRAALQAEGIAAERIVMRKPESTTGDGSAQEARRVEIRLAP